MHERGCEQTNKTLTLNRHFEKPSISHMKAEVIYKSLQGTVKDCVSSPREEGAGVGKVHDPDVDAPGCAGGRGGESGD